MKDEKTKREVLETKIKQMESTDNDNDLYEHSVKVADRISMVGAIIFIATIIIGVVYFVVCLLNSNINILFPVIIILSGFWTNTLFDWFSLILHNLAELNNKTK